MADQHDSPEGPGPGPDTVEAAFDELLLASTRLRMLNERSQQHTAAVNTGNPELDDVLRTMLTTLSTSTAALAENTERIVARFHPLRTDGQRGVERGDDPEDSA